MDPYQSFIHLSRYSRYLDDWTRRETWDETVDRLIGFWQEQVGDNTLTKDEFNNIKNSVYNHEVMPSMRSMWSAGKALAQNHFRGYNCSFAAINHPRAFDEELLENFINSSTISAELFGLKLGLSRFIRRVITSISSLNQPKWSTVMELPNKTALPS